MSQLVHVITPNGERYERRFPDWFSSERILSELAAAKRSFGFNTTVRRQDKSFGDDAPKNLTTVEFGDPKSGFAFDHPDTIVAIGNGTADGGFEEVKRIKGPARKTPQGGVENEGHVSAS